MRIHSIPMRDTLIFALDEQAKVISAFIEMSGVENCCADRVLPVRVANAGGALRLIQHHQPAFLIVCAGRERLDELKLFIHLLRSLRPGIPLLAIAAANDQTVERAVRAAGANYYFTLGVDFEATLLRQTLGSLGQSPPALNRFVRPRIRGRPAAISCPSDRVISQHFTAFNMSGHIKQFGDDRRRQQFEWETSG